MTSHPNPLWPRRPMTIESTTPIVSQMPAINPKSPRPLTTRFSNMAVPPSSILRRRPPPEVGPKVPQPAPFVLGTGSPRAVGAGGRAP